MAVQQKKLASGHAALAIGGVVIDPTGGSTGQALVQQSDGSFQPGAASGGMLYLWSGGLVGGTTGAVNQYLANLGGTAGNGNVAVGYPVIGARTAAKLYVQVQVNALATSTTVRIYKATGGTTTPSGTSLLVTVPANTVGLYTDLTDTVAFADGDRIDCLVVNTAGGNVAFSCAVALLLT